MTISPNENTYQFVLGWLLLITLLSLANRTRVGHVIIYYSLLLIILLILVVEYKQIAPLLSSIETVGQLNASNVATPINPTNLKPV